MKLTSTLVTISSKANKAGRRYFALQFVDHETGHVVQGRVSGDESNINAIDQYWKDPAESIQRFTQEMALNAFKCRVWGWPYAGSQPEELADFIRRELMKAMEDAEHGSTVSQENQGN